MAIDPMTNELYFSLGGSSPAIGMVSNFAYSWQNDIAGCEKLNTSANIAVKDGVLYGVCGGKIEHINVVK